MYRNDWRDGLLLQQQQQLLQPQKIPPEIVSILDMLAIWILDFTPKFASVLLTLFLATTSLYVGIKCIKQR